MHARLPRGRARSGVAWQVAAGGSAPDRQTPIRSCAGISVGLADRKWGTGGCAGISVGLADRKRATKMVGNAGAARNRRGAVLRCGNARHRAASRGRLAGFRAGAANPNPEAARASRSGRGAGFRAGPANSRAPACLRERRRPGLDARQRGSEGDVGSVGRADCGLRAGAEARRHAAGSDYRVGSGAGYCLATASGILFASAICRNSGTAWRATRFRSGSAGSMPYSPIFTLMPWFHS